MRRPPTPPPAPNIEQPPQQQDPPFDVEFDPEWQAGWDPGFEPGPEWDDILQIPDIPGAQLASAASAHDQEEVDEEEEEEEVAEQMEEVDGGGGGGGECILFLSLLCAISLCISDFSLVIMNISGEDEAEEDNFAAQLAVAGGDQSSPVQEEVPLEVQDAGEDVAGTASPVLPTAPPISSLFQTVVSAILVIVQAANKACI